MGAHSIGFTMRGDSTVAEVNEKFREMRDEEERSSYGWKSVSRVKFIERTFDNEDEAWDYTTDHAEKWDYVIAVKFKNENGEVMRIIGGWGAE